MQWRSAVKNVATGMGAFGALIIAHSVTGLGLGEYSRMGAALIGGIGAGVGYAIGMAVVALVPPKSD